MGGGGGENGPARGQVSQRRVVGEMNCRERERQITLKSTIKEEEGRGPTEKKTEENQVRNREGP